MASLASVHFEVPKISQSQLETIARALDVESSDNAEILKERCFERSYQVCKSEQWQLVNPIAHDLSGLVDKVGRTLLLRALMEQNDAVVRGLTEREIGLTTTDSKNNSVLVYLAYGAAGASTKRYEGIVFEKLKKQHSEQVLAPYLHQLKKQQDIYLDLQWIISRLPTGNAPSRMDLMMVTNAFNHQLKMFGYIHPGSLYSLHLLEIFQRKLGYINEADATKEKYRESFSFLFGFEPVPLERYSKQEILAKARRGEDQDVERFVQSCPTRFLVTPYEIPGICEILESLLNIYGFDRKDKSMPIVKALFHISDYFLEYYPVFFANCFYRAAKMQKENPATYHEAEAFIDKVKAIWEKNYKTTLPLLLQYCNDKASLKASVGNLNKAETDYRYIVAIAEKITRLPDRFFLCEAYERLASVLYTNGKHEESITYAEKSIDQYKKNEGEKDPSATNLYICCIGEIAKNLTCLKRFDEALLYAIQNVRLWEAYGKSKNNHAIALIDLGDVWDNKEAPDRAKARVNYKHAYAIAEEGSQIKAMAAQALGRSYLASGDLNEAICWSGIAVERYARIQGVLHHDQWKITIFEKQVEAYREWELALLHHEKVIESLFVTDLRRSRVLAHTLSHRVFPGNDASMDLTPEEMCEVAEKQNTTFVMYSLLNDEVGLCWVISSKIVNVIQINVKNIFPDGLENLLSETSNKSRGNAEALPFANLYKQFNELAVSARTNSEATRGDSDDEEWEAMLKEAYKVAAEKESKMREQLHTLLKLWYKELIEPIEEHLPKSPEETVTFIPDGPMAMLPFAIFEKPNGSYFVEEHASLVSPSIRIVQLLGELKDQRSQVAPSGKSIVVCNPKSEKVNRLATGDKEGQEVGALLHTPEERLMLGSNATVNRVVSLMKDAQWIHWSSHGNANATDPDNPNSLYKGHLYFAQDPNHKDGILYAEEISKIKLEAEFAFLSACYSGSGNTEYIHEGLVGFTRALASGGVLTTASSYWQLPDTDQTVNMIKTFYEHVLGQNGRPKLGKAIALQKSMLEFVNKEGENNPHKWNRDAPHKWGALFLTGIN